MCTEYQIIALCDSKLESIHNKSYVDKPELTDGSGLSVTISSHGVIAFQYRYTWQAKLVRLTIGQYPSTALKDARVIVEQMREL